MPFSSRCMTENDWGTIRYFRKVEFKRPELIGYEFMRWIDDVRHEAGVPMFPTSDARSEAHNAAVGGAKGSAHLKVPCNAMDFGKLTNHTRARILMAAIKLGCQRWATYQDGSIHLDRAEDTHPAPRCWTVVENPA